MNIAAEIRNAMTARNLSTTQLAEKAGLSRSTVDRALQGRRSSHLTYVALAEALSWDSIGNYSRRLHTFICATCGTEAVDLGIGRKERRYCQTRCNWVAIKRRRRTETAAGRVFVARRLSEHQAAVAAFCQSCEPDGLCRQADCPLRPVSPLPCVA